MKLLFTIILLCGGHLSPPEQTKPAPHTDNKERTELAPLLPFVLLSHAQQKTVIKDYPTFNNC